MSSSKGKVVYYVLGVTALATGIYFFADKDDVKRGFDWFKGLIKSKSKTDEQSKD